MSTVAARPRLLPLVIDLVALTKPRVTGLVMATAAVGMGVAPGVIGLSQALYMLATTALLVGAANSLNCWLERESDAFMRRTRERPLPAGRLNPPIAFGFATALTLVSLPMLSIAVNPVTGLLGTLSLFSYVWLYTPLKYKTPYAMVVGAVPGALPPLMGWTAVTGEIGWGGLVLFGIVFVWQMPHVIGLSSFRQSEYAAASIRVLPLVRSERVTRWHAIGVGGAALARERCARAARHRRLLLPCGRGRAVRVLLRRQPARAAGIQTSRFGSGAAACSWCRCCTCLCFCSR